MTAFSCGADEEAAEQWKSVKEIQLYEVTLIYLNIYTYFFVFLGPHLWHMEVPRLGVKTKLQLSAYTIALQRQIQAAPATLQPAAPLDP